MGQVPIPQRKPQIESDGNAFFDFAFDLGKSVLSRTAEVKLEEFELERLASLRNTEAAADRARDERLSTGAGLLPQQPLGLSQDRFAQIAAIGAIALLGIAFFSISRK